MLSSLCPEQVTVPWAGAAVLEAESCVGKQGECLGQPAATTRSRRVVPRESRAKGPKQDRCSVAWTTSWPVGLLIGRVQDKRKCDDRGRKQAGAEPWAGERWALGAPVSSLTGS